MSKSFNIISAVDSKFGIGKRNHTENMGMSWSLATDLKQFRKITSYCENVNGKNVLILGRTTAELIKTPLPGRYNIMISRKHETTDLIDFNEKEFLKAKSLNDALNLCNKLPNVENIFVLGGGEIYKEAINHNMLQYVYLTLTDKDFGCDVFFPQILEDNRFVECHKYTTKIKDLEKLSNQEVECTFKKFEFIRDFRNDLDDNFFLEKANKKTDENQYLDLLRKIIETGHRRLTRNGYTYSLFGEQLTFDLSRFPLYTTKKMFMRGIFEELKMFLLGKTDSKYLESKGVNIWRLNTTREFLDSVNLKHYREGDLGSMYFFNVKHFGAKYLGCDKDYTNEGYDQFKYVMDLLKKDPYSRRCIFTTFNPLNVNEGVLYPCHGLLCQFYVEDEHRLSCSMTMRSNDVLCGNPFNVSSYALLVYIMCELLNNDEEYEGPKFKPGKLVMFMNDVHLYEEQLEQAKEQLRREPFEFPTLKFKKTFKVIEDLEWEDVLIEGYKSHEAIKVTMIA